MDTPPPEYHAAEAPAPDVWLGLSNSDWSPKVRPPRRQDEGPLALAAPPASEFDPAPIVPEALPAAPLPRIQGALAARRLLNSLAPLPPQTSPPNQELLAPTTVQIAVDPSGQVITACLVANSGLPSADAAALAIARRLRFAPLETAGATPAWGRVVFNWQTVAPAPAAAPK